jgi:hypothetical protein
MLLLEICGSLYYLTLLEITARNGRFSWGQCTIRVGTAIPTGIWSWGSLYFSIPYHLLTVSTCHALVTVLLGPAVQHGVLNAWLFLQAAGNPTSGLVDQNGTPMAVLNNNTWGINYETCIQYCSWSAIPLVSCKTGTRLISRTVFC